MEDHLLETIQLVGHLGKLLKQHIKKVEAVTLLHITTNFIAQIARMGVIIEKKWTIDQKENIYTEELFI